jgi:hypothetical protein
MANVLSSVHSLPAIKRGENQREGFKKILILPDIFVPFVSFCKKLAFISRTCPDALGN